MNKSKINLKRIIVVFGLLSAMIIAPQQKNVMASYGSSAYQVSFAFYDPWYEPHYGAWFNGNNGSQYHYTGYGMSPPSPDWWGTNQNVALLSKSWLFGAYWADRWNPANHHAVMQ